MSQSHPRPGHAGTPKRRVSGTRLASAGALVVAAALVAPLLTRQFTDRSAAPALAAYVALCGALYFWFRQVQQVSQKTAVGMSLTYAALGAGAIWFWLGS